MDHIRLKELGLAIGKLEPGPRNAITDVPGIRVGHCSVRSKDACTGVTVLMPVPDDIYARPCVAACDVLNGFGKSAGLIQIQELGALESPIFFTNTLNVGRVLDAAVDHMVSYRQQLDMPLTTYNPVVFECNDSFLNHIAERAVTAEHVQIALNTASDHFEEGSVGAGMGMSCHGLKGGIGSASRLLEICGDTYTLGALVLSNHGRLEDLILPGMHASPIIGTDIAQWIDTEAQDKGSIIIVLATDAPFSHRQLARIARRSEIGLSRLGATMSHGSGEIALAFTTAGRIPDTDAPFTRTCLPESTLNTFFRATADAVQEAVIASMVCSSTTVGYLGHTRYGLRDFLERPL